MLSLFRNEAFALFGFNVPPLSVTSAMPVPFRISPTSSVPPVCTNEPRAEVEEAFAPASLNATPITAVPPLWLNVPTEVPNAPNHKSFAEQNSPPVRFNVPTPPLLCPTEPSFARTFAPSAMVSVPGAFNPRRMFPSIPKVPFAISISTLRLSAPMEYSEATPSDPLPDLINFTLFPSVIRSRDDIPVPVTVIATTDAPEFTTEAFPPPSATKSATVRVLPFRSIDTPLPSVRRPSALQSAAAESATDAASFTSPHSGTAMPDGIDKSASAALVMTTVVCAVGTSPADAAVPSGLKQSQLAGLERSAADVTAPPFQYAVAGTSVPLATKSPFG